MRTHDLVRLAPGWIADIAEPCIRVALERTPWAVVRRAVAPNGCTAIGVRGSTRSERWPLLAPHDAILACIEPEALASSVAPRTFPAFDALAVARDAAEHAGLAWGPCGSVGFELASGAAVVHARSDCDLVIRIGTCTRAQLHEFARALTDAPARIDVQIEHDDRGYALGELVCGSDRVLAKTRHGPRLVSLADCWRRFDESAFRMGAAR